MDSLALCGVGKGLSLCLALQADRVRRAPFVCALLMHVPKPPAVEPAHPSDYFYLVFGI